MVTFWCLPHRMSSGRSPYSASSSAVQRNCDVGSEEMPEGWEERTTRARQNHERAADYLLRSLLDSGLA